MADEEAAPVMETVVVTRSFKAAAALLGFMCFLFAIVTTAATSWSTVGAKHPYHTNGLFETCTVKANVGTKLIEEDGNENFFCEPHKESFAWRSACQALMAIAVIVMLASWILLTVGICSAVEKVKFTLYRVAIGGYLSVIVLFLIVLIIYPINAMSTDDSLGWVYVATWVNAVVIFIAALFVIIDKGEELTEREKVEEEEEEE